MNLCVDCKHCSDPCAVSDHSAQCACGGNSVVTGKPKRTLCIYMRQDDGKCGPEGMLFEARTNLTSTPPVAEPTTILSHFSPERKVGGSRGDRV